MAATIYKTTYIYECPVCGKETKSAAGMCTHIINTSVRFEAHWKWMAERGIKPTDIVGTYKPLIEVVKRKFKRNKCEEKVITINGRKPEKDKVVVVKR
ncbi:MAG: hypothetical protein MUO17_00030 [Dehalococcoidales bacterium]|nr:hypothetical protein [Dehalococcoidales bacterium]